MVVAELPVQQRMVFAALTDEFQTPMEIATRTGLSRGSVNNALMSLNAKGAVKRKLNCKPAQWRRA